MSIEEFPNGLIQYLIQSLSSSARADQMLARGDLKV